MQNHGIKKVKIDMKYKYCKMKAFDTDEVVEFEGWDLIDMDYTCSK